MVDWSLLGLDLHANPGRAESKWSRPGENVDTLVGSGRTVMRNVTLSPQNRIDESLEVMALKSANDQRSNLIAGQFLVVHRSFRFIAHDKRLIVLLRNLFRRWLFQKLSDSRFGVVSTDLAN